MVSRGADASLAPDVSSRADATSGADAAPGMDAEANGDASALRANPFGCKFAWGMPSPSGSLNSYGYLTFLASWLGWSMQANGTPGQCEVCGWLGQLSSTTVLPALNAYIIGFYGHANGLLDGNQTSGQNLTTGAGALILGAANAACPSGQLCAQNKIVQAYAYYAQQVQKAWPTKPVIWMLEGDYVQYAATSQSRPLTWAQLGQLAALITTAIKTNNPHAVVGINHSTWDSTTTTNDFWGAMAQADYDFAWTTGVGNDNGFFNTSSNTNPTATYAYLHKLTGRKILVDESAGISQAPDSWSNQPASILNARIAEGVAAINMTATQPNYAQNVTALGPQLVSTCP